MKKNLNKLVAVGIGLSIMSGNIIPVFAATGQADNVIIVKSSDSNAQTTENSNNPVLTIEDAVKSAIDNSYQISINKEKLQMLEDKRDFYRDRQKDANTDSILKELDDLIDDLSDLAKIQHAQADQNETFLEDKIRKDVNTKYNAIVIAEKELNQLNQNIDIINVDYQNAQLKKTMGVSTSLDVSSSQLDLDKLKNQKTAKEAEISSDKEILSLITGKDITKYSLVDNIQYQPLVIDGSLDDYMDKKIDTLLMYKKKLVEWNEDTADDTNVEPTEPSLSSYTKRDFVRDSSGNLVLDADGNAQVGENVTDYSSYGKALASYISGYGTYLETEYSTNTGMDSLNDGKRTLQTSMLTMYSSLKNLETQIDTLQKTLDLTKKQMDQLKLKQQVGLITMQTYNKQVLNVQTLETNLAELMDSYNTLKTGIQQPWTLQ